MGRKKKETIIDPEFEKIMDEFHDLELWWEAYLKKWEVKPKEQSKKEVTSLKKISKEDEMKFYEEALKKYEGKRKRGRKKKNE